MGNFNFRSAVFEIRTYHRFVDSDRRDDTVGKCSGMRTFGGGCRKIELVVGRLLRGDLPSIHTVHVQASSKSRLSRPLRASWTFVVVDQPFIVTVRCVIVAAVKVTLDSRGEGKI